MGSRLSGAATACMEGSAQGGYNRAMYCEACSVSFLALVSSFRPPGQAGARRALFFVHTNVSVMVPSASGNVGHRFGLRARRVFLVARVRASVVAISSAVFLEGFRHQLPKNTRVVVVEAFRHQLPKNMCPRAKAKSTHTKLTHTHTSPSPTNTLYSCLIPADLSTITLAPSPPKKKPTNTHMHTSVAILAQAILVQAISNASLLC